MFNRALITAQLLLAFLISNGQLVDQDTCGTNKSPVLNKCEAMFFDSLFSTMESRKQEFDFLNKKMAFFDGIKHITKEHYFTLMKGFRGPRGIDILNDKQKKETGYDAITMINIKGYQKDYYVDKLKTVSSH